MLPRGLEVHWHITHASKWKLIEQNLMVGEIFSPFKQNPCRIRGQAGIRVVESVDRHQLN